MPTQLTALKRIRISPYGQRCIVCLIIFYKGFLNKTLPCKNLNVKTKHDLTCFPLSFFLVEQKQNKQLVLIN